MPISYRSVNGAALDALKRRQMAAVQAVPVPFKDWSNVCMGRGGQTGWAYGWHVLVAGISGFGKTYVAVNAAAAAIKSGQAAAFHTLEMDWDELAVRVLSIVSERPAYRLSPGKHFSPDCFDAAHEAMDETRGTLLINDEPMYKLSDILDGIRRMTEQHGAKLHIIDYLQLAWVGDAETQTQQITEVSHAIRQVAKELNVVTLCLSQFNRNTSGVKERPRKEGMIGGSALENDADQVFLLDHSRIVPLQNEYGRRTGWIGWGLLDKNRHGPNVEIPIRFDADTGRIRQRDPDEIKDFEVEGQPKAVRE